MITNETAGEGAGAQVPAGIQRLERRISELEALNKQQQVAWEACAHLAEIGQMTTGVVHELRNPITVILGFAQQLTRQAASYPSLSNPASSIEREALRCNRMVQNILNFARQSEPLKQMENLSHALDNALTLILPLARARGIAVRSVAAPGLPEIYVNAHRIEQMVINLSTNALDAMSDGGSLSLELRPHPAAGDPQGIELCIQDTGKGIPAEIREKIFEPFFTTKERGKGTGLGLSMVRDIVAEHGGRIDLSSREGYGTRVSIVLPLGAEITNPELNPPRESSDSGKS